MRNQLGLLIGTVAVLTITGCAAESPEPTAPPTSATTTPSASAAPAEVVLPTVEEVQEQLDTSGDDTRSPKARFGAVIRDGHTEQLRNAVQPGDSGPAVLRVACSSVTGAPVTAEFVSDDGVSFEFEAQCGEAEEGGFSIVTTQSEPFDFSGPYTISVTPSTEAAIGAGVVQN